MRKIINYITSQTVLAVMIILFAVAPAKAWAAENSNQLDLSIVMAPETDLTVYVDGQYSGALSESYGFGDTATITAPEVSGKTFSHWEADGSVISYANPLKLTINAHTTICAVYADTAGVSKTVAGFTSITRTNEGDKISFQAIAGGSTVDGAGIVYSTTAIGENLKIGGTSITAVAAERLTDGATKLPESILDENNCWMLQIKPTGSSTVYHARAYVTVGGNTTYGDVKDVKLSELESGISMIANLEGFEPGTDDLLEEIAKNRANNPASVTNAPTAKNLNYNGQAQALVTVGEASGGEMQYTLGTDATTAPVNNLYTTTIPTATNAGTYYVWYKVVADDEHTDSEAVCVTVTITDEAVANVIDMIGKLPAPSEVTANDKEQIEAARAAYDALSDEQKGKIPEETLKKLTDAEAALAELQNDTGDTQLNPDGTKTVTEEDKKDNTIIVTTYDKKDKPVQQYIYKKTKGTSVDLKNVNSKTLKKVIVPETVKANGKTYKVTRIRKGFLKNCKQTTNVFIGKYVNTIDKNAFKYGKKVKIVTIDGRLNKVGKGAFKNTKKNVIIKLKNNAKNFKKNKKLLEKSGLPKNATVKRVKSKK